MQEAKSKSSVLINALLAAALSAVFAVVAGLLYSYTYGVNDDAFIGNVLMGAMTGSPDAHVVYIKYPLAVILTGLFKIIPSVNWHYALLISCFIVCIFLVNFRIFNNCKKLINKFILSIVFMLCFWFCLAKQITMIHYSMCAGVLVGTAIFWFLTIKYKSTRLNLALNYIVCLMLLFVAYALRSRTLFMLLPLAAVAFIYKFIKAKPIFSKKNIIRWIVFPIVLFIGVGAIELLHSAQYKDDKWQQFIKFNDARTTIYDFYGLPEYEKNKEIYESVGVDKTRQYMYEQYYLEFTNGTKDNMLEVIADTRVAEFNKELPFAKRVIKTFKELPKNLFAKKYQPISIFVIALFILELIFAIIFKKKRAILFLALSFLATLVPWLYMIFMNKPVERVTYGIWVANFVTLIAILIDNIDFIREKLLDINHKTLIKTVVSIIVILAFVLGIGLNYKKVQKNVTRSIGSGKVRLALEEYCESHPENLYIYETQTFNTIGYDMKSMDNSKMNLIWPGGWCAKMPSMAKIWNGYGISDIEKFVIDNKNVYFVSYADIDLTYIEDFYQANYKKGNLTKVEEKTFDGVIFNIYQLSK